MLRFVLGDLVTLGNTFTVSGVATDPTAVTLAVTDPAGTTVTYTYAGGTITKTDVGVYTRDVTANQVGTWTYTWTGTGAAADVADGSFTVDTVALDLLTVDEAKLALVGLEGATTHDARIGQMVTAVSEVIDDLCGPVVQRTVTAEEHDGGRDVILLRYSPVVSVTTVTEYAGTTAQVLALEDFPDATTAYDFVLRDGGRTGIIERRSSGYRTTFGCGRVLVTYVAGRYVNTGSVSSKFKEAAAECLARIWNQYQPAWARGSNPFGDDGQTFGFYRAIRPVVEELLPGELLGPGIA